MKEDDVLLREAAEDGALVGPPGMGELHSTGTSASANGFGFSSVLETEGMKADPTDVRINNRIAIFNILFPHGALSRAQVSRRIGLSRASVSEVVASMIDEHILTENGRSTESVPGRRGKRGTQIEIDTNSWNIISLDLSQEFVIQGVVSNLAGQILARAEISIASPKDVDVDIVVELCRKVISKAPGKIFGIGIAVPGVVDSTGTVIDSRNLDWNNVPLASIIQETFNLPCTVDNDANCALLAERFFGDGEPNLIFIQISMGIGAGVLINGSIVSGTNNAAGEIGHTIIDDDDTPCVCGKHGCLEASLCVPALRARFGDLSARDTDGRTEILRDAGEKLGKALSMSVSLLDVTDIAIYGPADIVNDTLIDRASEVVNERTMSVVQPRPVRVRRCEFGDNIVMQGETTCVLQHVLRAI
ncbi:hypothetical protein B9T39_06615 [Alloscardovia macacae]|uniref:NagC family transcriptional regulator n=1 Tax=Alloscardovia macacae TaxID=1160091 RepID=A0A1Y2SZJ7_9BIFI|nr:ROK family protein [Alloscardovia macacae]OTA28451.1 hypothetical protein B9T39_06615 [Alloscardovia macacae]